MAAYYLDTSAVMKRYVKEPGTRWVRQLFDPGRLNTIGIARISGVELVASVVRRARGGGLSHTQVAQILADFRLDFAADYELIDVTAALIDDAMTMAQRHALRGYDAVQLAAARAMDRDARTVGLTITLVSADLELNAAAAAEGLAVEDPNTHP